MAKTTPPKPRRRKLVHESAVVNPSSLKPHPENYNAHPPEQLVHIKASIEEHGFYRNIVVSSDGFILAGHGVVEASVEMGLTKVPIIRLSVKHNSTTALKVLTGDNEIGRMADFNDRQLTEILKQIREDETTSLEGTGFDLETLAALVLVSRPASEVEDEDAANHWVGVPGYEAKPDPFRLLVLFESDEARNEFMGTLDASQEHVLQTLGKVKSIAWPLKKKAKKHPRILAGDSE